MYYDRVLSADEALYVSRAQQRIAALSAKMAEEALRNDVDDYDAQLIVELEYSIEVLRSTFLNWSSCDIRMMMDYYTLNGSLVVFGFRSIVFNPTQGVAGCCGKVWATVPQLREVENNSIKYDAFLLSLFNQEAIDRADYDAYLLSLIKNADGSVLTTELIADITLGGIKVGTVFPIGTPLEAIWQELLNDTIISTSNFTFNSFTPVIEAGVNLNITEFTWDVVGIPENLKINDSKGLMVDVPVTGTSVSLNNNYDWSIPEVLTWTLSGDNVEDLVITVDRVYPSYFGKEATATDTIVTVNEAKILAGTKILSKTDVSITVSATTANTEQGFITVPKVQTGSSYTKWIVDNTNFSNIEDGEFIITPVDVTVGGVVYQVYRWGYRSPLTNQITLYR